MQHFGGEEQQGEDYEQRKGETCAQSAAGEQVV
ncbi:hypothetical protein PPM_4011 [Paenibacillus polymyxa M1]|nr:hypothetical protein PPM_4011 [Paenibacillus polymyxa M1]